MVKYGEIQEKDRHNMSSGQNPYVKFNAMHKLGSSPIGCEDFSIPRGITKWGIGIGSSPIGYEGCNLGKAKAIQRLN